MQNISLNVLQLLPALEVGGVERGTLEIAKSLIINGHGSHVISAGGSMVKELEQDGSQHYELSIGKKSPFTFMQYRAIKKYILDHEINVLHVRSRMPAWVTYLAISSLSADKRPVLVSTVHGPYSVNFYSKIMMRSDRIIAISDYIKDYIMSNYPDIDKNKISLIHRGVDNHVYHPERATPDNWAPPWKSGVSSTTKIITLPGRITRWKGQADFVDIIHQLVNEGMDVHGVIAGGAEKRRQAFLSELKEKVNKLQLDKHVSFIGQRKDMQNIMQASDVVLSLAKIPEAFGRTALEALALGTHVVAYDHGGAHEVLSELFPAGLCEPNNLVDANAKIQFILNNNLSIKSNEKFTLQSMIERTLQLYKDAVYINSQGQ